MANRTENTNRNRVLRIPVRIGNAGQSRLEVKDRKVSESKWPETHTMHGVKIMTIQTFTTESIDRLVTRARDGDQAALGQLFERFQPAVQAIIRRRVSDDADVQELAQDVFIKAMQKLHQLRETAAFPGWLRSIAVRHSINHLLRRKAFVVCDTDLVGQTAGDSVSPDKGALVSEQNQQLHAGLASLGEIDRRTLVAFYLHGQSLIEMADSFEAPVGTIKRRLHVARKRLAEKVGQTAMA